MKDKTEIKSAAQAQRESTKLPAIWSDETRLSQRTLIYVASLLEEIRDATKKLAAANRRNAAVLRKRVNRQS